MKILTIGLAILACTHLAGQSAHADQTFKNIGELIAYYDNNPKHLGGYVIFVNNHSEGSLVYVVVEVDYAGRAIAERMYDRLGVTMGSKLLLNQQLLGDYIAVKGFSINGGSCGAMVACLGISSMSV